MIKRIFALLLIFSLVFIMIVQAIEKKQNKQLETRKVYIKELTQDNPFQSKNDSSDHLSDKQLDALYTQSIEADADESPSIDIGAQAPSFKLKTLDGKAISLTDLKGKKVLLNFWATWCPPCRNEMPELEHFFNQHKSDITVIGINIDSKADVKGFVKKLGLTFPVLLDEKNTVNKEYGILSIPTTYLLNEKGQIVNMHIGSMSKKALEDLYKGKMN